MCIYPGNSVNYWGVWSAMPLANCNFIIACTPAKAITYVNYWGVRTRVCPWLIAFLCIFRSSSRNYIWGLLRGTGTCMPPTKSQTKICYFCMGCDACSCWSATVRNVMEVHTTGWPAAGWKFLTFYSSNAVNLLDLDTIWYLEHWFWDPKSSKFSPAAPIS